ncbi:MAG TPA: Mrp/NBP35 family ATP-binding protein [Alphaproteobacteria bacterium]|nr:Mrp/NBP35 family ATP-binding protein [Alphaproteobacteria bacterium]
MAPRIENVRFIVAVASGKGGVGKSATAANLAAALAVQGLKVGMLDADIYGPSQPRMLGVHTVKPESDGARIDPVITHGIKLMSMGFMVAEDAALVWRGPLIQKALIEMIKQVNWAPLDVLVVDMPPGTGDVQLSLGQQAHVDGAVIVSTPQDIALIDARKGYEMFKKINVPVLGMVENMSMFCCPECGAESSIFGHGGAEKLAETVGISLLAEVPLSFTIRQNTDEGRPVVVSAPDTPEAAAYRTLAQKVWDKLLDTENQPNITKVVIE